MNTKRRLTELEKRTPVMSARRILLNTSPQTTEAMARAEWERVNGPILAGDSVCICEHTFHSEV